MQRSRVEEDPPTRSEEKSSERTENDGLVFAGPFLFCGVVVVVVVVVVVSVRG